MSEYQTPESLERLLGDATRRAEAAPLIAAVRKQPFSVLLLDEFEKAHAQIWDVFLQVFDDGRLTDRNGRTVDLRHCVIILTSNLGSAIPRGPGVGFGGDVGSVRRPDVVKSVARSFRPEFLNRLDRVVVFRPLGREIMRALLEKELDGRARAARLPHAAVGGRVGRGRRRLPDRAGLQRRARRTAAEAGGGAARADPDRDRDRRAPVPRGRPVPLHHGAGRAPGSTSRSSIRTRRSRPPPLPCRTASSRSHGSRSIRRAPRPKRRSSGVSSTGVAERARAWDEAKVDALEAARDPAFWESEDRHRVLGLIEYLDRLGAATATAERLGARLGSQREGHSRELVQLAGHPAPRARSSARGLDAREASDATLAVRSGHGDDADACERFVQELEAMYVGWADGRGMRIRRNGANGDGRPRDLGARRLHTAEERRAGCTCSSSRTTTTAASTASPRSSRSTRRERGSDGNRGEPAIVRRYRHEPVATRPGRLGHAHRPDRPRARQATSTCSRDAAPA